MATAAQTRVPAHLWIVGILSLLWNCFGGYDYLMSRTHNVQYIASSMPGTDPAMVFEYLDSMPLYAQVGWGLGVWAALAGSVLLLFRHRWAVWAFGLSLLGMVLSFGYMLAGPAMPGVENAGMMKYMPAVIGLLGLAQFGYARAMEKNGILR